MISPSLISVDEARDQITGGNAILAPETVSLKDALGRVLATPLIAQLDQPPFDGSAMDGYAVRFADCETLPVTLNVVGTSAAGDRFTGSLGKGDAVRIYTGAPVPEGADTVVMQENCDADSDQVTVREGVIQGRHIRQRGNDFAKDDERLAAGTILDHRSIALAAAMNLPELSVVKKPRIALIATGDELVLPGETPNPDQIISSNSFGLSAAVTSWGGEPVDLGIIPDDQGAVQDALARASQTADVIVTLGGASVGDRDLIAKEAAANAGDFALDFWKIAMKPGKPLIYGRWQGTPLLGLPGNPVSALVTARLFLKPLIAALMGASTADPTSLAITETALPENGPRQDYVRAKLVGERGGLPLLAPVPVQDSAQLSALADAWGLIIRPPYAPAIEAGEQVPALPL